MQNFWSDTRGAFGPIAGVSSALMLLCVAISVDVSSNYATRLKAQNALDAATISAAKNVDDPAFGKAKGKEHFNLVFDRGGVSHVQVDFDYTDTGVVGTMSGRKNMLFDAVLPHAYIDFKLDSRIAFPPQQGGVPCITALSPGASPGVLFNSGGKLLSEDCEIHVHSNASPAFTMNAGVNIDVEKVCVKGQHILNNTGAELDYVETECQVKGDPYAGKFPVPDASTCDFSNGNYGDAEMTMEPGVYCGWHNFNNSNAEVHFEPGNYILKNGGWNVNGGTWTGEDVMFYYYDTSMIQFNSAVAADMTGRQSGPYKDVFMTERGGQPWKTQIKLNDSRGFNFEGIVYFPDREIVFNSGSDLKSRKMNMVADTFIFNTMNLELSPADESGAGASVTVKYSEPYIAQ